MQVTEIIIALQDNDLAKVRADKRLEGLPEKMAILECRKKQRDVSALRDKATALAGEVERAVARAEDETAGLVEKMAAEQAKMTSGEVTNHKELQMLSREIDSLRRKKEKLEMETVSLLEKAEKAKKQAASIDAATAKLVEQEAQLVEEFKRAGGEVLAQIESLRVQRETLTSGLPAELLERYERVRAGKSGIGVGILEDRTCTACGLEIPADKAQALKEGEDIGECPMCKRIIVVRLPAAEEQ